MGQPTQPAPVSENGAEGGAVDESRSTGDPKAAEAKPEGKKQKQPGEHKKKAKASSGGKNGKASVNGSNSHDGAKSRESAKNHEAEKNREGGKSGDKSAAAFQRTQRTGDGPDKPSTDDPIKINQDPPASSSQNESGTRDKPFKKAESPFASRKFRVSNRGWQAYASRVKTWAIQDPAMLKIRKALSYLAQKMDPLLKKAHSVARQMQDKVEPFALRTWPVVKPWLVLFGGVLCMLTLLAIECGSRGLISIFRLGLAAIFLVVWCSALNLLILSGFLSFCIVMVLSIAVAFFLGYTVALAVLSLYGIAVLWLYGSFWTTVLTIAIAGGMFLLQQTKVAFYLIMVYAVYSTICNGGWIGLLLCIGLACGSNDIVTYLMSSYEKNKRGSHERNSPYEKARPSGFHRHDEKANPGSGQSSREEGSFVGNNSKASTSSVSESETITPEEEIARLLACRDHYTALGLAPFDEIDLTFVKREYRKKAMLVHPDKNRGNDNAEEAFKRLQNAYETLLDDAKRKSYDDDLRREELLRSLRQHFANHQIQRAQATDFGRQHPGEGSGSDIPFDARRISCRTCNSSHIWFPTNKSKQQARWCQDCQDYHPAKNGDGWVEQSGHVFLFGIFQKVDSPRAYACSDNKIYEVTDWVICQGMKCTPNTHKPSFSVSTTTSGKSSARAGTKASKDGAESNPRDGFRFPNGNENMTEEEFFEWLENAMASGVFPDANGAPGTNTDNMSTKAKQVNRKKKKPKKQW